MKTIPSLIASSTIGIAATGLVLGKQQPSQVKKVRRTEDAFYSNYKSSSFLPRPGTSSTNFDVVINTNHPSVFSSESKKKTILQISPPTSIDTHKQVKIYTPAEAVFTENKRNSFML